jgi:hypothetical protein
MDVGETDGVFPRRGEGKGIMRHQDGGMGEEEGSEAKRQRLAIIVFG